MATATSVPHAVPVASPTRAAAAAAAAAAIVGDSHALLPSLRAVMEENETLRVRAATANPYSCMRCQLDEGVAQLLLIVEPVIDTLYG